MKKFITNTEWKLTKINTIGKHKKSVYDSLFYEVKEALDSDTRLQILEQIILDIDSTLEQFDFTYSIYNIISPKKLTRRIYFKIQRNRDYIKDLGDIEGHYIKMLFNERELRYLLKERSDTMWFYNLRTKSDYFSPLDYDPQYLFKKGELSPGKRSGIIYIPTKKQLYCLLSLTESEVKGQYIEWKQKNNIIDSIHFHSPAANFLKFFMEKKFNARWGPLEGYWDRKVEFRINDYITLKLEINQTKIYVNGQLFNQCKYLLINIPTSKVRDYDEIDSIDEASSLYSKGHETRKVKIGPETEFWGHCSNIQVWFENDYDTRLLHSNLSFPLLRKLAAVGDPLAKKVFKQEIALRVESNYKPVIEYLFKENYFQYFNAEEVDALEINDPIFKFQIKIPTLSTHDRRDYISKIFMDGETKLINYILFDPSKYFYDFDNSNLEIITNQIKQPLKRFKLANYHKLGKLPINNQKLALFEGRIKIKLTKYYAPKLNFDKVEERYLLFGKIPELQEHSKKVKSHTREYYYFKERDSLLMVDFISKLEELFDLTEAYLLIPKELKKGNDFKIHIPGFHSIFLLENIKELKSIFQMILSKKINQEHLWLREV